MACGWEMRWLLLLIWIGSHICETATIKEDHGSAGGGEAPSDVGVQTMYL
jgi:hypothetical protein